MGYNEEGVADIAKLKSVVNGLHERLDALNVEPGFEGRLAALEENVNMLERRCSTLEMQDHTLTIVSRHAFIRETATLLYVYGIRTNAGGVDKVFSTDCWEAARALWDAKPEDC